VRRNDTGIRQNADQVARPRIGHWRGRARIRTGHFDIDFVLVIETKKRRRHRLLVERELTPDTKSVSTKAKWCHRHNLREVPRARAPPDRQMECSIVVDPNQTASPAFATSENRLPPGPGWAPSDDLTAHSYPENDSVRMANTPRNRTRTGSFRIHRNVEYCSESSP